MTLAKVTLTEWPRLLAGSVRSMSGAVPKAFAQLLRPNPGRQLNSLGKKHRKQFIRDKTDKMRAEMNMPPVRWGKL